MLRAGYYFAIRRHEAASSISIEVNGKREFDAIKNVVRKGERLENVKQLSVIEGKRSYIASIIYRACPNLQVEQHCHIAPASLQLPVICGELDQAVPRWL